MLPDGWRTTTIGEHADLLVGFPFESAKYTDDPAAIQLLRGDNVVQGCVRWKDVKRWPDYPNASLDRFLLKPRDIVLAMDRSWVKAGLKCAMICEDDVPSLLVQRVARLRARDSVHADYLHLVLETHRFSEYVKEVQTETAIPHISARQILDYPFGLPPTKEQARIAQLADAWRRAVTQTSKLIVAKNEHKDALTTRLFHRRRRNVGGRDARRTNLRQEDWDYPETSQLFHTISNRKHANEQVLSVTQDQGVVSRNQIDRKIRTGSKDVGAYKLVEPGDFIISLRTFQGGLEYTSCRGVISPAYHVIRAKVGIADGFYKHYFKSSEFIQRLAVAVIGIRDGKQISYEDFASMRIPRPPIEEQHRIADALDAVDREIDLLKQQAAALARQKKGLMAKLLAGEIRVKG